MHTPSFSSQSSDGGHERIATKQKVYLKSSLCNDDLIIGMVRRLSFDSNRDIKFPLRHIELPAPAEPSEVDISDVAIASMRRRSPSENKSQEKEEIIDTSSTKLT